MINSFNFLSTPISSLNILTQNPEIGLGNRFIIILIAIAIAVFSRYVLMKSMNRLMMTKSKKLEDNSIIDTEVVELQNIEKIKFAILDSDIDFSNYSKAREEVVKRAKKSMTHQFKFDLIIAIFYAIVGLYFYADTLLGFENYVLITGNDDFEFYKETLKRAFPYFLYVGLFLVWVIMRYVGFRHQFKAYQEGVFRLITPIWKFIFSVFQTRWYMLLAVVVMVFTFFKAFFNIIVGAFSDGIIWLLPLVFHLAIIYKIRSKAKLRPNLKLLILRVFLINKTSLFTFSGLAKFWKHYGSYFTVSDPSFYRVYWKKKFNHKFPVIIVFTFLIYTQLENATIGSGSGSPFGPFLVLLIIAAIIFVVYSKRRLKNNFVVNKDALNKDLEKINSYPVKLDNTFKEKPMSCYDNTWKFTVEKLVTTANVVLMDLRGFSEKNKGCEFEVNLLLNTVSLDKILFLGYSSAIPLIQEVIQRKFETLEKNSPNFKISNPQAMIFEVKKESTKETQQIMDLLIDKAMYN